MVAAKRLIRRVLGLSNDGAATARTPGRTRPARVTEAPVNPFLRSAHLASAQVTDFDVAAPEGRAGAAVGRWLLRGFLALMIIIGIWSAFIRPFVSRSDDPAPAAATLNAASAQAAASRFALDYLSWQPGSSNTARAAALSAATAGGADAKGLAFTGSGYLAATAAVPAGVLALTDRAGVVTVDVRVVVAAPGKGVEPLTAPPPAAAASSLPGVPAADAAPMPDGYAVKQTRWLRLAVPVVQDGEQVKIAPSGPVLAGEVAARPAVAAPDVAADPTATSATREWISAFMAAYAGSDTAYQAADGVTLTGLASVTGVAEVASWALTAPNAGGIRTGTAAVTWKFAAADLSITQMYTLGVTQDADRWYVTTIGPVNPVGGSTS